MLKGHSGVGGYDSKAKDFRSQTLESQNLQIFVEVVKGDTKLKVFYSMVKYNNMFSTNNIFGSVIGFMGDRPLEGSPRCLRFHEIIHRRQQRWIILIMQLKFRAIFYRKGITVHCGIRQEILKKQRQSCQYWQWCPMQFGASKSHR